ncbi:hypothetical protein [Gilvimarinus japonicus]|uniref:SMI1/KNR4 family protein n=1 Tax=Gilvimarinus japonicus TaxID=1796469 RepID=A0ABV7HX73_9GAMM
MERKFPDLLKKLHDIEVDYADGDGIDFEPYTEFYSKEETSDWIKAWTGNDSLDGSEYLIFGQDGTGGYAAFWLVNESNDILEQPIVFFGSEGEVGVVSVNFAEYVWLFANGIGPYEAVAYPGLERPKNEEFLSFAKKYVPSSESTPVKIIEKAKLKYPDFEKMVDQLCQ